MKLPNEYQTREERREKYWLCIAMGKTSAWARRMRDWKMPALKYRLGIREEEDNNANTW